MSRSLLEIFDTLSEEGLLKTDLPSEISENLSTRIKLRPYQIEALDRWFYYLDKYSKSPSNPHLLFHMATGSGKTVLMAALILDLFKRGCRNFLFFVNSTQIIEKTKDNFLNQASAKYLFSPIIRIDGKPVEIQAVETFGAVSNKTINIHFTTVQGLHTRMHNPKEGSVTIEDFRDHRVVMISDEAHHLNAQTKSRPSIGETREAASWEDTVTKIFKQHPENILLEFTATVDLGHQAIKEKYDDKILFDYQLRHFREDGYSKDIELRQAHLSPLDRMMQVMILSQYRLKVAEAYGIHCKPVILMKSRKIDESVKNESVFKSMVLELSGQTLQEIREASSKDKTLSRAFNYIIEERGMRFDEFAYELQSAFGDEKIVNVNRLDDLKGNQIKLNSLEDRSNEIRVIFAVEKLNEGWDVLNLFDIVRLYETKVGKSNRISNTTMSEAQLIGRGARYFPFIVPDQKHAAPEKRKYDENIKHPLRILEELYYHCSHKPEYIDEIKRALSKIGMQDETTRTVHLRLKENFKNSQFYKIGYIWVNRRVNNPRESINSLRAYKIDNYFRYPALMTGRVTEESAFATAREERTEKNDEPVSREFRLTDFNRGILDFALDSDEFFHFANIRKYFPHLKSISQFHVSNDYLGDVIVEVPGLRKDLENMTARQKLEITQYVLAQIKIGVKRESVEFVGTTNFSARKISECFTDRTLKLRVEGQAGKSWAESHINDLNLINLNEQDWYAYDNNYGTDQEKYFIRFLHDQADSVRKKYDDFYLLRNDKAVKLYSFKNGAAFEPDFILFLRKKGTEIGNVLQLFIEPKGGHLMQVDEWKQTFLEKIQWKHQIDPLFEGDKYRIFGLPFFNEEGANYTKFKEAFEKLLGHE